jgi:hypothetical protein
MRFSVRHIFKSSIIIAGVFILLRVLTANAADDKKDMGGWEEDSPYNQLYNPFEFESFKGSVLEIKEVVPMTGMSPAVALVVEESENETVLVHLCPRWFANPEDIGIKKGDQVKIKGAWCEINGEDIFMASKVKKGDFFEFKVRLTKNGKPFWIMTPEELARERASD